MKRIHLFFAIAAVCSVLAYGCGEEPQAMDEPQNQSADPSSEPSVEPSQDIPVSEDPSVDAPVLNLLSEELLEFGPEGGETTISFETNREITITPSAVWIEVLSVGESEAVLKIHENESWGREGTVTLKAGVRIAKVTVTQAKTAKFAEADAGLAEETFTEQSGNVINPERGFYYPFELTADYNSISVSRVKSLRAEGHTVLYVQYVLPKYMSSDIPSGHLENMQKDMDAIREGGAKCVLRFCYKQSEKESNKPWDPEEKWVMRHIEQVKPLLQKNEDVIMVFQAGYIGVWGEWYYTDHFGMNPSSFAQYQPRRRVLEAMLEALPVSRQVAVRTPDFKMGMYDISTKDTLTAATAHDGSILSRIGGYNDCFVSGNDDYNTYSKGHSRAFWAGDSRYTFMGGETCDASSSDCNCDNAISQLEKFHWTYLNIEYNKSVLKKWKNGGCYDEVVRRLGYRFVLERLLHTPTPVAGEPYRIVLYMRNDGFSAPQNPRDSRLVFVAADGAKTVFDLADCISTPISASGDPRTWHSGIIRLEASFALPAEKGTLYLELSDPLLPDRVDYSIALANTGVWDSATGLNKLLELK